MPRAARDALGGYCCHVLNRGNGRGTVFHKEGDFAAFAKLLREAGERTEVWLLAWCLLSNHFHLLLWPRRDGELSASMKWLSTQMRRYHQHYHSSGPVWRGRFRSFPIQGYKPLLTVQRYIGKKRCQDVRTLFSPTIGAVYPATTAAWKSPFRGLAGSSTSDQIRPKHAEMR